MGGDAVSVALVGFVTLAAVVDLWRTLGAARPPARPRAASECRCPYCHEEIADGTPRVRCLACGTRHHEACWVEHRRCSVFGCGSQAHRPTGLAPAEPTPAPATEPEPTPGPVAAAAPADPAG